MKKNQVFLKQKNEINLQIPKDVVIAIRALFKKYPKNANYSIKNLNIDIKKGQFHAFIGSNGAGKTTTIKIIIGATKKFEGNVYINQMSNIFVKALSRVAYIPEVTLFPPKMKLKNFWELTGRMFGIKEELLQQKIKEIADFLNLEKFLKKNPENFSSGEQKKALLGQALLKDCDVFVMDEPAANLDPQTRYELFGILKKLQEQDNKTIFISSHVLAEIQEYADSVTIIENGEIKISGSISEFSGANKNIYHLVPFDFEKALNFVQKNKIANEIKDEKILIPFESEAVLQKFIEKASKAQVFFKTIEKNEMNLKDIYSSIVLKENQKIH